MIEVVNKPEAVERLLQEFARTTDDVFTMEELRKRLLSGKQLKLKYGVDLTSPDMHIGHAVNLWTYRALQDLGHKVILLLGDFTTRIGDPTGRSKARPVLSEKDIERNAEGIYRQAMRVLRSDSDVFELRRNSEWLDALAPVELLRLMSTVTVDKLMSRDMFRKRTQLGQPISAHELVYPLLQGWDSVVLKSDLTVIGSDQLFNEMMGRELQQRQRQDPQVILTTKITPGLDGGEKQSKSLGNYVAIDHSSREKFGRLMTLRDELIGIYAQVYSDLRDDELEDLATMVGPDPRQAKAAMAQAIVRRYHGLDVAQAERAWFDRTFSRGEMPQDVPVVEVGANPITALELIRIALGEEPSNSELRRIISQGGVRLDGEKIDSPDHEVVLGTGVSELRVGKRQWFKVMPE